MDANQLVWVPVAINGVGLVGLAFAAGRYVQRLSDVEAKLQAVVGAKSDLAIEKMNGRIDLLTDKIGTLTDSLDTAYDQLGELSRFLMGRKPLESGD